MERETGFEPATSTLARSHSTTELFPLNGMNFYIIIICLSRNIFSVMRICLWIKGKARSGQTRPSNDNGLADVVIKSVKTIRRGSIPCILLHNVFL